MNQTFIMFKPDANQKGLVDTLLQELQSSGCVVLKKDEVNVTPSLILTHYQEVIEKVPVIEFKDRILREFQDVRVTVAIVTHPSKDVISHVRQLIGATEPSKADPNSLRGKYADDDYDRAANEDRVVRNLIHASDSEANAQFEINLWFNRS